MLTKTPERLVVDYVGAIRVRGLTCACGRRFVAGDFAITDDDMRLTCGGCHDRPLDIELRSRVAGNGPGRLL